MQRNDFKCKESMNGLTSGAVQLKNLMKIHKTSKRAAGAFVVMNHFKTILKYFT